MLVVASPLQILHPNYVLDQPGLMNIDTIATLFGLTIVTGCLKDHGAITWAMRMLKRRCSSPSALVGRVIMLTTFLSALVTNDACVLILTQPLLDLCLAMGVSPMPFLIALSTSANLGSVATLIGNPQNVLIAGYSGINFFNYALWMLPALLVGNLINFGLLLLFFQSELAGSFEVGESSSTPRPWPKHKKLVGPKWSPQGIAPAAIDEELKRNLMASDDFSLSSSTSPCPQAAVTREQREQSERGLFSKANLTLPDGGDQPTLQERRSGAEDADGHNGVQFATKAASLGIDSSEIVQDDDRVLVTPCGVLNNKQRRRVLAISALGTGFVTVLGFATLGSISWTVLLTVSCLVLIDV
eukprot:COSAG02_NODE_14017_length_1321_cov_1.131751_1_plen_356_part_10